MKISYFIIFICAVCFTERYSCLRVIDVPLIPGSKSSLERSDHFTNGNLSIYSRRSRYFSPNQVFSGRKQSKTRIQLEYQNRNIDRPRKAVRSFNPRSDFKNRAQKLNRVLISAMPYPPVRSTTPKFDIRRYFLVGNDGKPKAPKTRQGEYEDEKDANLKTKISTLVEQTIHDTARKIKSVAHIKEKNRNEPPYKAGFILSMIKKSRDMLNELFNVAVKHKDEWKALEQLKIFELIVHTNVDTTNLVRQLVEIHIQHMNTTTAEHADASKRRVVLLK